MEIEIYMEETAWLSYSETKIMGKFTFALLNLETNKPDLPSPFMCSIAPVMNEYFFFTH